MCGFSVVVPVKDECAVRCVGCLKPVLFGSNELIVVGDSKSLSVIKSTQYVKLVECSVGFEEAVNLAVKMARNDVIVKLDADISIVSEDLLGLIEKLRYYDLVSCPASTRAKSWFMNFLFVGRDIVQHFAPLKRSSHGNTLIFRKRDLAEFGGFHFDTKLHLLYEQSGKNIFVARCSYAHEFRRNYNVNFVKKRQVESGVKRCQLGIGLKRSLFHAIVRGRPFVVAGWLKEHFGRR